MASYDPFSERGEAGLVGTAELRRLHDKLCGTVLRRSPAPGREASTGETIVLRSDGAFVRERGAEAGPCTSGRWTVEEFLGAPTLVLRQVGAVSTFLPHAAGGRDVEILGGQPWTRVTRD